jgi:hypothetical protein
VEEGDVGTLTIHPRRFPLHLVPTSAGVPPGAPPRSQITVSPPPCPPPRRVHGSNRVPATSASSRGSHHAALNRWQLVRGPLPFLHALAAREPEARSLPTWGRVGVVVGAVEHDVDLRSGIMVESTGGERLHAVWGTWNYSNLKSNSDT